MVGVTEVSSRPNDILNFGKVNCLTDNKVDHFTEFSTEAMWQVSDTHVGSTDRKSAHSWVLLEDRNHQGFQLFQILFFSSCFSSCYPCYVKFRQIWMIAKDTKKRLLQTWHVAIDML